MPKSAGGVMPLLTIQSGSNTPVFLQLYAGIREAILQGRLKRGTRLPSTRSISSELGISRNTVLNAFEQLIAEGYLQGRIGSGTRVTDAIPERIERSGKEDLSGRNPDSKKFRLSQKIEALSSVPVRISPIGGGHARPFRVGTPDLSEFPLGLWQRIQSQCISKLRPAVLDYGDAMGHAWLRRAVCDYVKIARGVNCSPDQVMITTGSQQAIDLLGRVLLDPGDSVWMEEPGYLGARGALVAAGANVIPVPVDQDGMQVESGVRRQPKARLVYVSPSHQLPLGVTMSLSRRFELLNWAAQTGAWILEDDYDSEFRYRQRPICSLQGLDRNERVVYMGTFSKVLFPGLRVGYLIVPAGLIEAVRSAQHFSIGHPPIIEQLVLAEFMKAGHFERHIRRMRVLYRERQDFLIQAASRQLDGLVKIARADTGMHVVAWLPKGIDDAKASLRAARAGIEAIPLSVFYMRRPVKHALLLGYAAFHQKKIQQGVAKLRKALL